MADIFIYENHLGQRFDGSANGVYLNQSDLRDYGWDYSTINGKITSFRRGLKERSIPLVVHGATADEATAAKNRLHEIAEADIMAVIPGKIIVGDYYTTGFIKASAKANYMRLQKHAKITLTLLSDDPAWYRDETHSFFLSSGDVAPVEGMGYPYDYPYDYAGTKARTINCDSVGSNAFRMRIYGPAVNPSVSIGGHIYAINGTIAAKESLLIDGQKKTITLTRADGSKVNWFSARNRESYVFQEIPPGQHTVSWNETFGFDLTIIEKRSEPKWI